MTKEVSIDTVYDMIMQGVAADPAKKQFFDAAVAEAIKSRDLPEKTKEFKDYDALVFEYHALRRLRGSAEVPVCCGRFHGRQRHADPDDEAQTAAGHEAIRSTDPGALLARAKLGTNKTPVLAMENGGSFFIS